MVNCLGLTYLKSVQHYDNLHMLNHLKLLCWIFFLAYCSLNDGFWKLQTQHIKTSTQNQYQTAWYVLNTGLHVYPVFWFETYFAYKCYLLQIGLASQNNYISFTKFFKWFQHGYSLAAIHHFEISKYLVSVPAGYLTEIFYKLLSKWRHNLTIESSAIRFREDFLSPPHKKSLFSLKTR